MKYLQWMLCTIQTIISCNEYLFSESPHESQQYDSRLDEELKPSDMDLPVSADRSPTKSPYSIVKDEDDEEILNKDFPDEIPIIDTQPLKGRPLSSVSSTSQTDRKDFTKKKQDGNIVLNYLKKNRYDDSGKSIFFFN